jgi:hypothetical protein
VSRRGRIQIVGKLADREMAELAEAAPELERELRREWRTGRRVRRSAGEGSRGGLTAERAARPPADTGDGPAAA